MSLRNVIQVGAPLMMNAVEMNMVIAVTVLTTTLGLTQTCLQYCTFSPANSSTPPGCDCSRYTLRKTSSTTTKQITPLPKIKNSGIYYDSEKQIHSQNTTYDEQTLHILGINPIFDPNLDKLKNTNKEVIFANADELFFAKRDSYDESDSRSANKSKRSDIFLPKADDETKEPPLYLYLDIDITSEKHNKPHLEELKRMFEDFQTAEKKLSECINLHIYIFSKYIDTINKTNANWGQEGRHDNLSNFQQLTEIESKCDQPTSIIKHSIYQIKQFLSREDTSTEIIQGDQKKIDAADSNKVKITQNPKIQFGNENTITSDMYHNALTTNPADIISIATGTEAANIQFYKNNLEYDNSNLLNTDLPGKKNNDITSTSTFYEGSTVYNKINLETATDPIDFVEPGTTIAMDRTIQETDMLIPRIITKELANGTLLSVVDGYEKVPNSDFITNSIMSTPPNIETHSNPVLHNSNIHEIVKSDIVNIHGNLYFSFGETKIPARFIQQSNGELDLAIDGFSMCGQVLEQNTSSFMNSLCKCILSKNCT